MRPIVKCIWALYFFFFGLWQFISPSASPKRWQSVILLHFKEACWGLKRWWQKEVEYMWIPCAWRVRQNKHMRGENTESHPILPPASLCYHRPSLCVCGCVSERNNAVLQSPSTIVVVGVKRVLEKSRAGWYSGLCGLLLPTVCGKTFWGTQTRHSFTHRLHYTRPAAQRQCRRVRREGWRIMNRETFQTEYG